MPLIGITCREIAGLSKRYPELTSSAIADSYSNALIINGASPVLLPVVPECVQAQAYAETLVDALDGFVFSGGDDIVPRYYGEYLSDKIGDLEENRDIWEFLLIQQVLAKKKPILAICRGIQLLNVACGGSLYQDQGDIPNRTINHSQNGARSMSTHPIAIEKGSRLHSVIGNECWVNSFHHQAIKKLGDGLKIVAKSPDGVVEAVESLDPGYFLVGVQFHPEAMVGRHPFADEIFQAFIAACQR